MPILPDRSRRASGDVAASHDTIDQADNEAATGLAVIAGWATTLCCASACPAKAGHISGHGATTPRLDVALRMIIVADSHADRFWGR